MGVVAGLIVLLLAAGGWFWSSARQHRGTGAYADAMLKLQQLAQAGPEARVAAMSDLEGALASYPSNALAPQAAYELGNLRFDAAQYDKARAAWQITIGRSNSPTLTTLAKAGIGYAWEAERKLPEATRAYETALAELKPTAFYYEELLMDLARAQELEGKKDAATATYRKILKDLPRSARVDDIRTRLAKLGAAP